MSYIVFLKLLQFAAMFIIRTSHIMLKQYIKEGYSDIDLCVQKGRRVGIMNHGIQKEGNLNKERASFSCI